jgi:LPXTG-site transpeptidase (sortase) family protein
MLFRLLSIFINSLIILAGFFLILIGSLKVFGFEAALGDFPDPVIYSIDSFSSLPDQQSQTLQAGTIPASPPPEAAVLNPAPEEPPSPSIAVTEPQIPTRVVIPSIQLDAPVLPAVPGLREYGDQLVRVWDVPAGFQAGWHSDSAPLGVRGNVVFNGHHNVYGQVFGQLIDVNVGDEIIIYGEGRIFRYQVTETLLVPERDQPLEVRLANSQYIQPTGDYRLTLVTCWPYETNTHRLIVIAALVEQIQS